MRFGRQLPAWSPLTLGAVLAGVRAGWLGGGEPARRELEAALDALYGPRALLLTDSGTSALTLALKASFAVTGAPVVLPAYCCYDVATAADGAAVPFLLYDIDPTTLSPDGASLRRALEAGARTIVVAHLYGVPVDLAAVRLVAGEYGALVIEDAAQGSGCSWRGRPAGAHGDLGVLSFGRGKGVTGGKGGALLVNAEGLEAPVAAAWEASTRVRRPRGSLRDLLLLAAQWAFGRPWLYWIPASLPFLGLGETRYRPTHPVGGISDLSAGVLRTTLPLAPAEVRHRVAMAVRLRGGLPGVSHVAPPEGWTAGWLRYPVVLQRTAAAALNRYHSRLGAAPGYPRPLSELPGFGDGRLNRVDDFPGARVLAARLVTCPTHRHARSARFPAFR